MRHRREHHVQLLLVEPVTGRVPNKLDPLGAQIAGLAAVAAPVIPMMSASRSPDPTIRIGAALGKDSSAWPPSPTTVRNIAALSSSVLLVDLRLQRVGAWCGIVSVVLFLIFFGILAGLIPPLSPTSNAQEIARFFVEHKLRVRLGVALALLSTCVALPFLAVICLRVRRVESRWGVLALTQLFAGVLVLAFIFPVMAEAAAAFRPEQRPPEITQTLNDVFWLTFIGIIWPRLTQALVLTVGDLRRPQRPADVSTVVRHFNIWFVLLSMPGSLVVVFNDGPLAWNGVFAFWIPLSALVAWMVTVAVVMLRSIRAEETATAPPAADP